MNRIRDRFRSLKEKGTKAFIPYITPEFPVKGATVPLVLALEKSGASHIELGIPFSDPIADGETIQRSSHKALLNGVTVNGVLAAVREVRRKSEIPLLLMGYTNPIFRYGMEKFLREAKECGVDGMIVPDLLPEESDEWRRLSNSAGISDIFLVAPTTPGTRIAYLDSISNDFTYCVSVTGVTGARTSFGDGRSLDAFLSRVRKNTTKPFVVGFGISTREQAALMCRFADGVVIGSALLRAIENDNSIESAAASASRFFSSLVGA